MSEEGASFTPIDAVELANAMTGLAGAYARFVAELIEQGVPGAEAHKAARAWVHGTAGGKFEA